MARKNTRNTYSRRNQSATSSSLAGVWLLLGILLGVGIMGLAYIFYNPAHSRHFKMDQSGSNDPEFGSVAAAQKSNRDRQKTQVRKSNGDMKNDRDQRFEFYTMLPGMEVELPESQTAVQTAQPPAPIKENIAAHPRTPMQTSSNHTTVTTGSRHETTLPAPAETPKAITRPLPLQSQTTTVPVTKTGNKAYSAVETPSTVKNIPTPPAATIAQKPVASALPTPVNSSKPKSSHYIVQAGIFQSLTEADALKARLTLQGFAPQLQKVQTQDGHAWFRVTLGPFASETLALNQKKRLEDQKVRGILILQRPTE